MTRNDWYRTLGRCIAAAGLRPCQLLVQWHWIEDYCDRRRGEGATPYAVAAELWWSR